MTDMNERVELLHALVSTPSVSRDEGAVAEVLVGHMNANGFDARVDEVGNAVGIRSGGPSEDGSAQRSLVLLGHIDTVPGDVPIRFEGGALYGRGSVDAKGSIATFTRAVLETTPAAGVDLIVVGAVEEESETSRGARFAATQYAPEACLIGEPSGWDAVTIGYKGCARVEVDFVEPCGHTAGPLPPPSEAAAALWHTIKAWTLEFNEGKKALFDHVMPRLIEFNTTSDGLHDRVHQRLGLRLPLDFDIAVIETLMREQAPEAEIRFYGHEVAWASPQTSSLARTLRRSILQAGGKGTLKRKTGTSDMNVVGPAWQCPIVAYGPGDSTLDHTPNEHVPLEDYEKAIDVLKAALVGGGWAVA